VLWNPSRSLNLSPMIHLAFRYVDPSHLWSNCAEHWTISDIGPKLLMSKPKRALDSREPFRRHSYFSDLAVGTVCGLGSQTYESALRFALHSN
jgi:dehydroquinase class II